MIAIYCDYCGELIGYIDAYDIESILCVDCHEEKEDIRIEAQE